MRDERWETSQKHVLRRLNARLRFAAHLHDDVELDLVDLRALVGSRVKLVADLDGLGGSRVLLQEFVLDALLDVDTGRGAADLAVVEEDTHVAPLDGVVNVGVFKDDGGRLAAEFEGDLLEVGLGGGLQEETAGTGGAGEGDLVDLGVLDDGSAGGRAVARDDVEDTSREGLGDELGEEESRERGLFGRLEDLLTASEHAVRQKECKRSESSH